MSSSDVQNSINQMNAFVIALARYSFPVIFTFGVVCNLLNVYVFTRPNLRTNPCCMYFLSSSIAALLFTVFNFPLRTLQLGYSIDPTVDSQIFCQLKSYLTFSWRALAIWFLVLASVDRFLHSSTQANIRKLSSFRIARCSIPLTIILIHAAYSHIPVFYGIVLPRRSCTVDNSSYGFFLGIWHLVMYGLGPPLLMLTFSLLTIQHISRRKILPIAHSNTCTTCVSE
ncbi:hypothetical protein I4U23_013144 [Adineta vaga]|nr:hypothetical protein I4U23_013144 [Adineta vaga]